MLSLVLGFGFVVVLLVDFGVLGLCILLHVWVCLFMSLFGCELWVFGLCNAATLTLLCLLYFRVCCRSCLCFVLVWVIGV